MALNKMKTKENKKIKNILYIIMFFMSPFILMSIGDYSIPLLINLSIRTSILLYIHGAINQLIALIIGILIWNGEKQ